jgi:hypothetical protein
MRHGHSVKEPTGLEMPDGFDPCGTPCAELTLSHERRSGAHRAHAPRRRRHHVVPGLAPTSLIASVAEVAVRGEADWLIWGCAGGRPVLFDVEAGAAEEMMDALARGEAATAIVEPSQLMLERLD